MTNQRFRSVLLFGAPGVGKGTQGQVLGQIPGFFHMASGDAFRALDKESPEGKEAAGYSSRGELVPDDLTIRIWKKGVDGLIAASRYRPDEDLLILDGIPRTVPQAELLEEHVDVLRVVYLVASDEDAMVARIKGRAVKEGRADDDDETIIRRRFEVYREESEPVLNHYSDEIIARIDGMPSPAEVARDVLNCLIPVRQEHF